MQLPREIAVLTLAAWAASALAQSNPVQAPPVQSPDVQSIAQALKVLTNPAIVALAAAGFTEDFLIELIRNSRTEFDTSANALASLTKQGINERIIRVMVSVSTGVADPSILAANTAPTPAAATAPTARHSPSWLRGMLKKIGIGSRAPGLGVTPRLGAGAVEIESVDLPRAIGGRQYSATIRTSVDGQCPAGNVGLFLAGGSLPPGLRITYDGLAGVPTKLGAFRFSIGARNSCVNTTREFELLVTGRAILRVVPEHLEFTVSADSPPLAQTVLISSTWPGLPYTLSTAADSWLTLRQAEGTTPQPGAIFAGDRATVAAIPMKLAPGVHHSRVIVSAWQADPIAIDVTVTVSMPKPVPESPPWLNRP
jgi:hypothetical protein